MSKKTIEQLEEELEMMKSFHRGEWEQFGSGLYATDMLAKEDKLENEIAKLKAEKEKEYIHDISQILDD